MKMFIGTAKIKYCRKGAKSGMIFIPAIFVKSTGIEFGTECKISIVNEKDLLIEPMTARNEDKK